MQKVVLVVVFFLSQLGFSQNSVTKKLGDFTKALENYEAIITNHKEGIYIDEALYFSAEIYAEHLKDNEKAKPLYEQVILNHEDSIYSVEARKKYRQLRGDNNL